ncbi:hypothetical protein GX441_03640 [bacterium]|nr:hypothetical protein [bacterium]
MKRLLALIALAGAFALVSAQNKDEREGAGGIIFGPGFSFALGAPKEWIFDTELATAIGARAVMYPAGTELATTDVIIYANAFPLEGKSVNAWLTGDIEKLKKDFPGVSITEEKNLMTADSLIAIVRGFAPAQSSYPNYERTAYIMIGTNVAVISLSAQSSEAFKKSVSAFEYVVTGFRNIGKELLLQGEK